MDSKIIGARGGMEWIRTTILVLSLMYASTDSHSPWPITFTQARLFISCCSFFSPDFIRNSSELTVAISQPPHPLGGEDADDSSNDGEGGSSRARTDGVVVIIYIYIYNTN